MAPIYEHYVHPGMQAAYPQLAGMRSKLRIDPNGPERGMFESGGIRVEVPVASAARFLGIHELQHMIDRLERHARGGSWREFLRPGISLKEADSLYESLASEVAARNAVKRLHMTDRERQVKAPRRTEDAKFPRDRQIIRFYPEDY